MSSSSRITLLRLVPVLDFGGVESILHTQAQLLDRDRFELKVCTFWKAGDMAEKIRAAGIEVVELGVDPAVRNPRATLALIAHLSSNRPDLLHASLGEANFHAALASLIVPPRRALLLGEQGVPDRQLWSRLVHALMYQRADQIVCVSESARAYLAQREWAPRDKLKLVYECADPRFFDTPRPAREAHAAPERIRCLCVGRLAPVKNHALLIEAFAKAHAQCPELHLTLAGEGPCRPTLEAQIARLGIEEHVNLAGFISDVLPLLDASDLFLLPSLSEGLGLALIEAMARAVPVLSTDRQGAGEIMAPLASQGWVLDPEDETAWTEALVAFARASPAERAQRSARALERAQAFSPERYLLDLTRLYEHVLAQGEASPSPIA